MLPFKHHIDALVQIIDGDFVNNLFNSRNLPIGGEPFPSLLP
jgi:hypothetical protein